MKLINVTDAEKNQKVIEFSVDKATFDAAVDKVYKKNVAKLNVPGFRRGKAPKSMIEKMYGKGFFYEDAINDILPEAYEAALAESGLDVVSYPEIDIKTIDDNGVVITAKVFVKPEAKIGEYKGIEATRDAVVVSDEAVDAEINNVRERNARETEVTDRAVENGDEITFDFDGYVDGVAFDGGKSENYNLKVGSGSFIPGFEEQIVGKAIGEKFDINVTFPAEYHAAELANKEAVFKCVVHAIKVRELPELDDEFVKDVSEFDTVDEYRADVKAKLQEKADKEEDAKVDGQLMDKLVETLDVDVPEAMFETEVDAMMRDYETRLRYQGLDLETFMRYTGQTVDAMKAQFRPQAEKQVKTRLALEAVAKAENFEATAEEIEAEYGKIAEAYGIEADKVRETIDNAAIAADIVVGKAAQLIRDTAVVTVKDAE
ncbi:MAG: trigger factor [Ruminococcaceae bacterium]|nr:trigger factor [Oscillospiraceae bacterium]